MPTEHQSPLEPQGVSLPSWVGKLVLLTGAGLMTFSLVRNDGEAGALTALGAGGLGLGLGYIAKRRGG